MKCKAFFIAVLLLFNMSYANIVIAYDIKNLGNYKDPTPHQKVELDKIQAIANKNNIEVLFKPIPWKRSLLLVEKGFIEGVIQASYKVNRAKYAAYPMNNNELDSSKRLNDGNSYYIYRNKNTKLRWNGEKFNGKGTIAVMDKYAVIDDLKKHSDITIKTFLNNSEIIRKLSMFQLDAYAGESRSVDRILKKYPSLARNIIRETLPIRKKDYFLIFSKIKYKEKSKEMNLIWEGLKEYNHKK